MAHTAPPAAGRAGQVVRGLLALVVLAGVLIGLPAVLYWAAGNPLPHHLPTPGELWALATTRDDGRLFVHALAIVAWVAFGLFAWAWLGLLISVIVEIPAQLRRRRTIRIPGFGVQQRIAAALVAAIIGIVASPTLGMAALTTSHATRAAAAVVQDQIADVRGPAAGTRPVVSFIHHPVTRGESLLGVAEHYGVPVNAVAEVNYGITQPDGRSLQPGNTRIYAGWSIRVPTSSADGVPVTSRTPPQRAPQSTVAPVYQVRGGDWLWYIADRFLGDPERYTDIAALNPGLEAHDHRFPDHIEAPWHIRLPADAVDRGPRQHATGVIVAGATAAAAPTHGDPQPPRDTPPGGAGGPAAGAAPATPPPASTAATIPATPSAAPTISPATPAAAATPTAASTPNGRVPSVAHPTQSAPAGAADRPNHDTAASDDGEIVYGALAGAGLLAALLLAALYRRRRRQQQHRRPGQRLSHPRGGATERSLRIAEQPADVDMLDDALRSLAADLADRDQTRLPDIVGAWIVERSIHLILAAPCPDPPPPWTAHGTQWTLDGDADIPQVADQLAPLPTLVAVGSQPGRHLLLDLERLGAVSIAGDADRAVALLRYLAGELACNSWSDDVEITIAGFPASETALLVALNPDRIRAASSVSEAASRLRRRASAVKAALGHAGAGDALAGRIGDYAEAWAPQVLLVAEPDEHHLDALTELGHHLAGAGRCAVAIATTARRGEPVTGHGINVTAAGELHVELPFLRTTAASAGLPVDELEPLAEIMRQARVASAEPIPAAPEPEPWAADTDAAGALLNLYTHDEPTHKQTTVANESPPDTPPNNPMEAPTARAEAIVAVTTAPRPEISAAIRQRHRQADPHLDADLTAWREQDPTRPRIGILGPVTVEAPGDEPAQRRRFHAEIIVFLAQRGARGATADHLTDALWPDQLVKDASRRVAITRARRWLGTTPAGGAWLPEMSADRIYRLEPGYLLDWHLFRRLRSRGETHGPAGIDDLRAALELVRGVPLEGADRPHAAGARNPYTWLPESDIYPGHMTSAIVDTAHQLAELYLDACDTTGARWAVHQAWLADPYRGDEEPWHDLMRAAHTDRHTAELRSLLGQLMAAREAEVPEDLNKDTYAWLRALLPDLLGASSTPPTSFPSAWPTGAVVG